MSKHFAVVGRVLDDLEDSILLFECDTEEEAWDKFIKEMEENAPPREPDDNEDRILINAILESETPIEIRTYA